MNFDYTQSAFPWQCKIPENSFDPIRGIVNGPNEFQVHVNPGLTKRELFAAMAIQGMLANANGADPEATVHLSNNAVAVADALLERLKK